MRMSLRFGVAVAAACCLLLVASGMTEAHAAGASNHTFAGATCSSGTIAPGSYSSLVITGNCSIPSGTVNVSGNLTVKPGATLDASSPDQTLLVGGNVLIGRGAALNLGCAIDSGCPIHTNDRISGNLVATQATAVILHGDTIRGNVTVNGGGGGLTCDPNAQLGGAPAFSDIEDSTISGNVSVTGLRSCWFGFIRNHARGSVVLTNNRFADLDAMEVVTNTIAGNLVCSANSPAPQTGDSGGSPNTVKGNKTGQCAHIQ